MVTEILNDPFLFWSPPEKWVVKLDADSWDDSDLGKLAVLFRKKLKMPHPYFYLLKVYTQKPIIRGSKLYGYRWYLMKTNLLITDELKNSSRIPNSYLPQKGYIFLYSDGNVIYDSIPHQKYQKYQEITPEQFKTIVSSL